MSLLVLVILGNFIYRNGWCGRFSSSSKPETLIVAVSVEGGVVGDGFLREIRRTFIVFSSNKMWSVEETLYALIVLERLLQVGWSTWRTGDGAMMSCGTSIFSKMSWATFFFFFYFDCV